MSVCVQERCNYFFQIFSVCIELNPGMQSSGVRGPAVCVAQGPERLLVMGDGPSALQPLKEPWIPAQLLLLVADSGLDESLTPSPLASAPFPAATESPL